MNWSRHLLGYVVGILVSTAVLLFGLAWIAAPAARPPYLSFLIAVSLATWIGGLYPGIFATILGLFLSSLFFLPPVIDGPGEFLHLGLFGLLGLGISLLGEAPPSDSEDIPEQHNGDASTAPPQLLWTTRPDGFSGYRLWFHDHWSEIPAVSSTGQHREADATHRRTPSPLKVPCHHILVVDDSQESAETLSWVLESLGQRVATLFDGALVLDWALLNQPDIVFLDIGMPGLNGYEVARQMRQHRRLTKTVLVALTCYDRQADRARTFEAGFNFHLTKPAEITTLTNLLIALPAKQQQISRQIISTPQAST